MAYKLSNNARLTLVQALAAADTTAYVSADDAALLPSLGVSDQATAVMFDGTNREIVYITAVSGGTLTIARAKETTTARAWPSGTILIHTPTAAILQAVLDATTAVVFAGTSTMAANLYTIDLGVGANLPTYADGERASFLIDTTNTGAVTVAFTDGTTTTATKSIQHQDGQELEAGDFEADWLADLRFNEANDVWYVVNVVSHQLHGSEINDGPLPGVNRHPNGKLDFWNNGTSFSTPASASITADGWEVVYDGSIGAFTVSRQAFTLGQTDVPSDPKYWLRWDQSGAGSGSTQRRIRCRMPGVNWREGDNVSARVWLKADASRTVTGKIIQHFGTGGSPSADVELVSTAFAVTTSWTAFDLTGTFASIAGKVLGSAGDDAILLTLDLPLNVTMTIDVANADVRPGHITGRYSDTFPLPFWLGGTGGSYLNLAAMLTVWDVPTETYLLALVGSNTTGEGASLIGIEDTGGYYTGTDVEAALQEIGSDITAIGTPVQLKGTWDASSGSFPGAGAAQAGWSYIVSVDGTVDSVPFVTNDRIVAIVNNASTSTYTANWHKLDYTDQVLSVAGKTGAVTLAQADISGLTTADSPTFAGLALSSGATINWNSGDMILTHVANALSLSGGQFIVAYNGAATTTPAKFTNTTDAASVVGAIVEGDRATPTNNDNIYMDFRLSSAGGVQTTVGRIGITNFNVTAGAENAAFYFSLNKNGAVTNYLYLGNGSLQPITNDQLTFGAAGYGWKDVYLADGCVVDWGNGGANLTHDATDDSVTMSDGGFETPSAISTETTGTLTGASRNRIVRCSGNVTLPSSGCSDGDTIVIDPRGTARTITRPGSHTMYIADADSATGTTTAHHPVTAMYHGSSKWTLNGQVS